MNPPRAARLLLVWTMLAVWSPLLRADHWPQWRGPNNNGIAQAAEVPVTWSEKENVAWKVKMPGMGGSTPVLWENRIFLTSEDGEEIVLLCLTTDGKELWKRSFGKGVQRYFRGEGNNASASPSTDGTRVYCFAGSGDLACFDFDGKEVWKFNVQDRYGRFRIMHGMHVTPLLHGDRLYMSLLHQGGQWVVALDKATGKEVWKVERPTDGVFEGEHSYASPSLWQRGKETSLIVHGCDYTTAHSLDDGKEVWRLGDLNPKARYDRTFRLVASPAISADVIVVPTAKNGPVVAVKPDGKGLIREGSENEHWRKPRGTTDVPSPLIHDGLVYMCRENGILVCMDAKTGKEHYQERLHSARYRASPVLADGKLYLTARDGVFSVIQTGTTFKKLAENRLPDSFTASPVIVDGRLYLRGFNSLWAIGAGK